MSWQKTATKVRGVRGSSSQEIHRGVKWAPLGDSPDCSARNTALSKAVSGAALSFRFIVLKDDRVVAARKSVSPCHKQGRAPSSSAWFPKSSFSFPLLFSRVLSLHLSCLRPLAEFFRLAIKTFLVQHLWSKVNICDFMRRSPPIYESDSWYKEYLTNLSVKGRRTSPVTLSSAAWDECNNNCPSMAN